MIVCPPSPNHRKRSTITAEIIDLTIAGQGEAAHIARLNAGQTLQWTSGLFTLNGKREKKVYVRYVNADGLPVNADGTEFNIVDTRLPTTTIIKPPALPLP